MMNRPDTYPGFIRLTLLTLTIVSLSPAQTSQKEEAAERRAKTETILRIQDTRTIHDGKLISLMTDPDAAVRERAVHAFGSIQDTSVINLLVDRLVNDGDPKVQSEAAFAIGQTAGQLSSPRRERLAHELIWTRLDQIRGAPADRLIEEIGKFGTETALTDMMRRFGNEQPPVHGHALVMSLARFAIRGIVVEDGVLYLLKLIKPPDAAQWEAVYAMQRIGDHRILKNSIEEIVKLTQHPDPLVRMQTATILGKVKDESVSLIPLQKLADSDPDWRVRVSALRALGNFKLGGKPSIVETFRRSFFNGTMGVALTALSVFGTTDLRKDSDEASVQAFSDLERIAANRDNGFLWQLQAEAAGAVAALEGAAALPIITPRESPWRPLNSRLIVALGTTGSPEASALLSRYLEPDNPVLYSAALEGFQILGTKNPSNGGLIQKIYEASIAALSVHDMAVVTTAASILGDSLFRRPAAAPRLAETLERLRVPDDVEAIQEIAATLGKLKEKSAVDALRKQLEQPDRSVARACASALKSITGRSYTDEIPASIEPLFTDFDFSYLNALPETVRVKMETIRGDVTMELYKKAAPFTVMSFLKLATQRAFYRGLVFHRVVPNFVIQGGDPRGDGWGGPGYSIRSEFSTRSYETGSVGIASAGKDTEGSQFFVTQSPQPHLDGRYTNFGKVVSGMDAVDKIQVDDHIFDVTIVPD
ncbi:MAG TPA: peptidylprolyl isomerase [Bacteroidota bacterium]|nr:peptidylprolyl isomerase [Bacteroidota bacterium]